MSEYKDQQDNPLVSREFQDATDGRVFSSPEKACEFYLTGIGIDARFLPMEREEQYPSIVRSCCGKYSIGISQENYCKNRCCAVALAVIYAEKVTPGFIQKYINSPKVVDKPPHCTEILRIQYTLFEMKAAS